MSGEETETEKSTKEDLLFGGQVKSFGDHKHRIGCCYCSRKYLFILFIVILILLAIGLIILAIYLKESCDRTGPTNGSNNLLPDTKVKVISGAVVSDHEACSQVGRDILAKYGTAVDAAIATLLCNGARTSHSMGIGGGCFMLVYNKNTQKTHIFDGRETAPHQMTLEEYSNMTDYKVNARRIGVPGEILAYHEAHLRYGRLPWKELFEPSIEMMRSGFPLSKPSADGLKYLTNNPIMPYNLTEFPGLCEIFCADKQTGQPKVAGDMIYMPKLADTYEGIAKNGPKYLYASPVTRTIVNELRKEGAVLDQEDFTMLYKPLVQEGWSKDIGDFILHSMGDATGGPVVAMVSNILKGLNLTSDMSTLKKRVDAYHKIIEALKFTYAEAVQLGDPDFEEGAKEILRRMKSDSYAEYLRSKITEKSNDLSYYTDIAADFPDTQGTSHVSVLSPYGDAVSVTSTINWYFGSMIVSNSTGIIWNNEMDDFNSDEVPVVNFVEPGKRPRSSMTPIIVSDKNGQVRLITGAAGGARIATSVAQIVAKLILMDQPLMNSIEEKRFHHTLFPDNTLYLERGFPEDIEELLKKKGHKTKTYSGSYMGVLQSILVDKDGKIEGYADKRKPPGDVSYVYKDLYV